MANSGCKETVEISKDNLCCSICLNLLTVPKTLVCFHTFCVECLQKFIEQQTDALQKKGFHCPVCKQFTEIPNPVAGWASQLVTDFRVQAMVESSATQDSDDKRDATEDAVCLHVRDALQKERKFTLVNAINGSTGRNSKITGVVVLFQEGKDVIVICDREKDHVKAFWLEPLKDRELSCKFTVDTQNKSLGRLAKINDTQIVVSVFTGTKIHILNVNNGFSIHRIIDTGNKIQGIGVIRTQIHSVPETRLVVGFEGGLSILDMDGSMVRPMDIDISGNRFVDNPWYLSITPAGNIIVSDRKKCLLCITQKREVLWRYETTDAAGTDYDAQGNIYVSLCDENKVVLLSPDGEFVKELLSADHDLETPRGIFYDYVKGRLFLVQLNGLIKIFELK